MKLPSYAWILGGFALYALSVGIFLGTQGAMSFLLFGLLYVFPIYLILDNFSLDGDEKFVFSVFLSVGAVPAIVYWLGFIITIQLATLVAALLFSVIGIGLKYFGKK